MKKFIIIEEQKPKFNAKKGTLFFFGSLCVLTCTTTNYLTQFAFLSHLSFTLAFFSGVFSPRVPNLVHGIFLAS